MVGGFSDWYLPSKDELNLMYVNLHLNGLGNFYIGGNYYWSSTEDSDPGSSSTRAWAQNFGNLGFQYSNHKGSTSLVRAIRSF